VDGAGAGGDAVAAMVDRQRCGGTGEGGRLTKKQERTRAVLRTAHEELSQPKASLSGLTEATKHIRDWLVPPRLATEEETPFLLKTRGEGAFPYKSKSRFL
jgi:hypothetical protein